MTINMFNKWLHMLQKTEILYPELFILIGLPYIHDYRNM